MASITTHTYVCDRCGREFGDDEKDQIAFGVPVIVGTQDWVDEFGKRDYSVKVVCIDVCHDCLVELANGTGIHLETPFYQPTKIVRDVDGKKPLPDGNKVSLDIQKDGRLRETNMSGDLPRAKAHGASITS